jgi:small-conductance mechanosensitive channel
MSRHRVCRGGARWLRLVVFAVCAVGPARPAAWAQPTAMPSAPPTGGAADAGDLGARRAALGSEIAAARQRLASAVSAAQEDLNREIALLQRLDLLYVEQATAAQQAAEARAARAAAEQRLNQLRSAGLAEPAPYSFLFLDALLDEWHDRRARTKPLDRAAQTASDALEQARLAHDETERQRREAQESLETNRDAALTPALERALRRKQLESRLAAERVRMRELELERARTARDAHGFELTLVQEKIDRVRAHVRFTRKELNQQLARLDAEEAELAQALAAAKLEGEAAERLLAKTRQRLDQQADDPAVAAELAARRAAQQARQREVTLLGQRLQHFGELKDLWTRRFRVATADATSAELQDWAREARALSEQVRRERRAALVGVRDLRDDAAALRDGAPAAPEVARWLREQERALADRIRVEEAGLDSGKQVDRVATKLADEIAARAAALPWHRRLVELWGLRRVVWRYELFAVADRPITVGKLVSGIALLALGLAVSGRLSRWLGRRLLPRFGLETGVAAALQALTFYAFVLLFSLIALRILNVPLTIFTLLGGALAIGVGFGSQNIVNNFISGLILLAERPVRVGDIIEIEGTTGTVEHIGPRSTRLRAGNNIALVVPNSAFLDKNVVNWTLATDQLRTSVRLGVAYGSPTREVRRLLHRAAAEHPRVARQPEPVVLFADFGDDALIFEVHFSLYTRDILQRRIIESEVRLRIDDLLREAGIVIAFPQRDVHLDAAAPLAVRLVGEPPASGGDESR